MTDATCPVCGMQCRIMGDPSSVTRWYEPVVQAENELEQSRVQLAGCLTAAEGHNSDPAKQGDYGWSLAYQKTLELRAERDALKVRIEELEAARMAHTCRVPAEGRVVQTEARP